jgi:hypothetical protein
MALTMRKTGLASPIDEGRKDFTVYCGEWPMGRIYEQRGGPHHMRWFWSLYGMAQLFFLDEHSATAARRN